MSFNRDKVRDLQNTKKALAGKLRMDGTGYSWLGHKIGAQAFLLDVLLLKGVPDEELLRARDAWRQHIYHLRHEHGLEVERDGRGYWKITGKAHSGSGKKMGSAGKTRNEITDEQYCAG